MKKTVALICVLSFLLCGCSDAVDINKKRIITAIVMDKKDNEVCFNVEVANIEGGTSGEGQKNKYIYVKGKGENIIKARRDLDMNLDQSFYVGAIQTVILTESFAAEHLSEFLYRLRSQEQYRKKVIITTTPDEPDDLISACEKKQISLGFTTESMLETLSKNGESFTKTTESLIEKISEKNNSVLIPSIGIRNNTNTLLGYSVIKNGVITGNIPVEQARGIIILNKKKAQFSYTVPYENEQVAIKAHIKSSKITPKNLKDNIGFDINIKVDAKLMYTTSASNMKLTDGDYKNIKESLTNMIKNDVTVALLQAQSKYGCDYLRFDDVYRVKYPEKFSQLDWTAAFTKAQFDINIELSLNDIWLMDYKNNKDG